MLFLLKLEGAGDGLDDGDLIPLTQCAEPILGLPWVAKIAVGEGFVLSSVVESIEESPKGRALEPTDPTILWGATILHRFRTSNSLYEVWERLDG